MITLQSVTLQRGTKILLDQVSLSIFAKQKVGVIGLNGCGKSSLFSLLLQQLQPDAGQVFVQSHIRIASLSQEMPNTTMSAMQYAIRGDTQLSDCLEQLKSAEINEDSEAIARLHQQLYDIGGYAVEARAAKLLNGLGFSHEEHSQPVNEFSGGWRMRLNLVQLLMSRAELLLLDEPTNYLDLDAIIWLERWLQRYDGTLLLVSHDREFLDHVVQHIVFLHHQKIELYAGNYSSFETQRAEKLAREKAQYEKQQAKVEHLMKFVNQFRAKASKAKQAQSRLKALERMDKITLTHIDSPFTFKFYEPSFCASPLLSFDKVDFSYGDHAVLTHIDFSLGAKDRVGILGHNGAGKSTFMKILAGILKPTQGFRYQNRSLKIGYFAQHQVDQLDSQESAFVHIHRLTPSATEQQIRAFLGGFNFRGDMIFGSIDTFSGGEKARLVLAMLVWQKPNVLLLDEPTNHLDLEMKEALAYTLQEYSGALVLVSHDRYLLKSTVDEFYLMHDRALSTFKGDLNDYERWLFDVKKELRAESSDLMSGDKKTATPQHPKQRKADEKKIRQIESKLDQLTLKKALCEEKLADASIYAEKNKTQLAHCVSELKMLQQEIEMTEQLWMTLHETVN